MPGKVRMGVLRLQNRFPLIEPISISTERMNKKRPPLAY